MHDINRIFTHSYSALIISDNFDTFSIPGTDLPTVHKNEPLLNQIAGDKPMSKNEKTDTRRAFLKTLGIAGVGSLLIPLNSCTETSDNVDLKKIQPFTVPTRPYGKTGENVSILSLGGVVEKSNQVLDEAASRRKENTRNLEQPHTVWSELQISWFIYYGNSDPRFFCH